MILCMCVCCVYVCALLTVCSILEHKKQIAVSFGEEV